MYVSTIPATVRTPVTSLGAYRPVRALRVRRAALQRRPMPLGYFGSTAANIGVSAGVNAATAAVAMIPVVGQFLAPFVSLLGGLWSAHELRAKQAKNENSAMNVGVAGFDSDLKTVQAAYNSGQIDAAGAINAANVLLQNYWALVSQYIQPGRNGCASGSSCPSSIALSYCSGDIGAACCVGCADLNPSINGPNGVIAAIQGTSGSQGGRYTADIVKVFGSKYGGQSRSAYQLDFTPGGGSTGMGVLSGQVAGLPLWVWIGAGGLLLFLLFAR